MSVCVWLETTCEDKYIKITQRHTHKINVTPKLDIQND